MNSHDVVGWWSLVYFKQEYDDGRVILPFGEKPEGRIIYSQNGEFCVIISRSDRASFTTGGQWNASDSEKAAAYNGMLAYRGTFHLEDNQMTHVVSASLYPNWEDARQVRHAKLKDGELTLTAKLEQGTSEARSIILKWQKISA